MARSTLLARRLRKSVAQRMEAQAALKGALLAGVSSDDAETVILQALKKAWPRMPRCEAQRLARDAIRARQPYAAPSDGTVPEWATALVRRAQQADRRNGREGTTITVEEVVDRFRQQDGRCYLSGIRFSPEPFFPEALVPRPFAPSLDQEKPGLGYAPKNVRLVCTAANFAKNSWNMEVLLALAEGVAKTRVLHANPGEQ